MKMLSIKLIIEFRAKTDKAKLNFAKNLKFDLEKRDSESGGDYWISCLSTISNSYKLNNLQLISDKIYELEEKFETTEYKRTKTMYERNITILSNYEVFDFKKWKPDEKIKYIKKHKTDFVLTIKGLQVQVVPHHVFSFQNSNVEEIGAIWFIAKLGGYRKVELGMFTDILYRYLKNNFSKDYTINPSYCIAVDVVNKFDVNYSQLRKGEISSILDNTIDEIKKLI